MPMKKQGNEMFSANEAPAKGKQVDRMWRILALIEERLEEPRIVCVRPLWSEECIISVRS